MKSMTLVTLVDALKKVSGNRCYFSHVQSKKPQYPLIVYNVINIDVGEAIGGEDEWQDYLVQVDYYAKTHKEVIDMKEKIAQAVDEVFISVTRELCNFFYENDQEIYRLMSQFKIGVQNG